ncbi:SH3 domain-containing protein [Steroidobacter cummioxidans]|uniref:SH3 domain-containing protein n=1 Tax=Steroidobacter cummioxidans TaxID=1803913 RepID=UPI000E322574|nr:SH3 domain-containing protein [Steroidobacter cummioxidans]
MKNSAAIYCLVIATTLPLSGVAQETSTVETAAAAEPAPQQRFVSDKLVLNVYSEPDQGSDRIATIQTGDAVEELERAGNLVRVRLAEGREGWVGASYLTSDAPAIVRLRELQRQQPTPAPRVDKASLEEIAQLKKENTTLRGQVSELQARVVAPVASPPPQGETITEMPAAPMQAAAFPTTAPTGVMGWLVAMLLVGAASFAGGYQMLARRLRKRFGGLKIY